MSKVVIILAGVVEWGLPVEVPLELQMLVAEVFQGLFFPNPFAGLCLGKWLPSIAPIFRA